MGTSPALYYGPTAERLTAGLSATRNPEIGIDDQLGEDDEHAVVKITKSYRHPRDHVLLAIPKCPHGSCGKHIGAGQVESWAVEWQHAYRTNKAVIWARGRLRAAYEGLILCFLAE